MIHLINLFLLFRLSLAIKEAAVFFTGLSQLYSRYHLWRFAMLAFWRFVRTRSTHQVLIGVALMHHSKPAFSPVCKVCKFFTSVLVFHKCKEEVPFRVMLQVHQGLLHFFRLGLLVILSSSFISFPVSGFDFVMSYTHTSFSKP